MQIQKITVGCLQSFDPSIMHLGLAEKLAPECLAVRTTQPPRRRKGRAHGSANLRNSKKRGHKKSTALLFGAKNKDSFRRPERTRCFSGRVEAIRPEIRDWRTDRLKLGEISG